MKNPIKVRLYVGFAAALILVVAGGIVSYVTFQSQQREAGWVEHTYEVITQAQRINRYVYEIESSGIVYRSTQDKKFQDPYFKNRSKILPLVADLRKLTVDNPDQVRRGMRLENDMIALMNYWERLYYRTDSIRLFNQLSAVAIEERKYLDSVHNGLTDIITEERLLLSNRNQASEQSVSKAVSIQVADTLLIIIIAMALMMITFGEFRNRIKAQQEVQHNLYEQQKLTQLANEKNWLLTGVSRINDSLRGDVTAQKLAEKSLFALVKYLEIPAGAFYCYDEERHLLKLYAGLALPASVKKELQLNEGITGHAAMQKEMTVLNDVPAGYWHFETASGNHLPGSVICLPLWYEDELIGVIELAIFKNAESRTLELLRTTAGAIAVAINAATARAKVNSLLLQVQDQKEVLETQQEELRQSNEELMRQQEVLQASEEELRVQEEELRQINDEMNVQNRALEVTRQELSRKAEELEQSSRYKSEFLANMSHELRTPLNSVLILARLLEENKDHNLTTKQQEYAGIIHRSGSDLLRLINDILDLSKIEAGKVEMNIEPVSVKSMTSDLQQLFQVMADQKNIRFITSIGPDVEMLQTDNQRLEQVIKNLLSNAFKFTPNGGTIRLDWTKHSDGLHIAVSDTGTGIPLDKQQLIFEAFRQADGSTSRKYGGTGLGLSISKELVKRLGGVIRLTSEEGQGSTFTVIMPLEPAKPAAIAKAEPEQEEDTAIPEKSTGIEHDVEDDRDTISKVDKVILIIEDDAVFASLLRDKARLQGYKTIVALNGSDGLYFARKFLPAAILLDMNLPLIDGNSILKILKSNEDLQHILVHVISAGEVSLQVRDKVEGYTQKPLQMTDLDKVFSGIHTKLQARFKKVLVVSTNGILLHHPSLQSLSDERQMQTQYQLVDSMDRATKELQSTAYDGIVLDAGKDIQTGIAQLGALRQLTGNKGMPIIVYLDHDISEADELALKKDAAAIVRNSTFSADRLMDELELFLYKLRETQPDKQGPVVLEKSMAGKKVLLADDDMRNVFSLSALLEEQGMNVITAADGREALERLAENPDTCIVLMDIMMPEMDGYEAIRRIREEVRWHKLPVIALTAKAMAGDREKCIAAGASDYIAKPIESAKLLSLMRVWMA
jgi:signal transduction histidine kinase/DNA-binding response OmpR family regulator/CHASE3 domain sensor protein